MPHASIVVPTYNGAAHLCQCLDSALAQSFPDFELLIVDDHSTDGTARIAAEYVARDQRVRFEPSECNAGMVGNWNRAIGLARGKWIKLLFQDDLLAPGCLATLLDVSARTGSRFAACFRNFVVDQGVPSSVLKIYKENFSRIRELYRSEFLSPDDVARFAIRNVGTNFVGEPTVTLLHRSLFETLGGFDPTIIQRVDTEYWIRAGLVSGVAMERQILASFRVHGGSASATNYSTRQYADNYLDSLILLYRYLNDGAYAHLRSIAAQDGLLVRVGEVFNELKMKAERIAMTAEGESGDRLRHEWRRVVAAYPAMGSETV